MSLTNSKHNHQQAAQWTCCDSTRSNSPTLHSAACMLISPTITMAAACAHYRRLPQAKSSFISGNLNSICGTWHQYATWHHYA